MEAFLSQSGFKCFWTERLWIESQMAVRVSCDSEMSLDFCLNWFKILNTKRHVGHVQTLKHDAKASFATCAAFFFSLVGLVIFFLTVSLLFQPQLFLLLLDMDGILLLFYVSLLLMDIRV